MQGRGMGKLECARCECVVQPWLGGAEVDEAPKKVWPAGTMLVAKSKTIARAMRSGFKLLQLVRGSVSRRIPKYSGCVAGPSSLSSARGTPRVLQREVRVSRWWAWREQ